MEGYFSMKRLFGLTNRMLKPVRGRRVGWAFKLLMYLTGLAHFFRFRRGAYRMKAFSDPFSFWLWTRPEVIRSDERMIEKLLLPGDTFVDVGANCGLHTLHAAYLVKETGKVLSFEPVPDTFKKLVKNVKLNKFKNVDTYNTALGNEIGEKRMNTSFVSDLDFVSDSGNTKIKMSRLDDLIKLSHIKLLKVDAEGYELFILQGGENTLENTDYILIEVCEESFIRYGYHTRDLLLFLKHRGFTLYAVKKDGKIVAIDENYLPNQKYEDILASRFGSLVTLQNEQFLNI